VSDTGNLQFDRAESGTAPPQGSVCVVCKKPPTETYFDINGKTVCADCRTRLDAQLNAGTPTGRFLKALALGTGGALLGAGVYLGFVLITHFEWSLIAIGVGYLAGKGVRKGSGGHGGWVYESLAVGLTYCAFIATYARNVVYGLGRTDALSLIGSPIIAGVKDPLSLIIIAIGIYAAWKINRGTAYTITGPYRVVAPGAGTA
jgi:hypothetical protein